MGENLNLKEQYFYDIQGSKMFLNDQEPDRILRGTFGFYRKAGIHEKATTELFKSKVKPGNIVLDLGANLGYFSLLAARLVGEQGKVYAFEPEPVNRGYFLKNIELNNYKNIMVYPYAVSNKRDKVKLYICPYDSGHHTLNQYGGIREYKPHKCTPEEKFIEVETVKLDDCLKDKKIDVIKMDVEGSEMLTLMGMDEIIQRNENLKMFVEFFPLLIREMGSSPEEFIQKLFDYGFSIFMIPGDYHAGKKTMQFHDVSEVMRSCPPHKPKSHINLYLEK